ncbi:MAG TPA: hypothetical protein PKH58_05485 [Paludibacteraceae bacterium]|nr:hypothetical protein [Paludibacteraceae bacterium]
MIINTVNAINVERYIAIFLSIFVDVKLSKDNDSVDIPSIYNT